MHNTMLDKKTIEVGFNININKAYYDHVVRFFFKS